MKHSSRYTTHIAEVHKMISPFIRRTPLLQSAYWSKALQANVSFKCEVLQYTGAFKVRGALHKLLLLEDKDTLLVTASGGNHGLALAYAARKTGHTAKVFVPESTPAYKIDKIRELGTAVEVYGAVWDDTDAYVQKLAQSPHTLYVHPFSDDAIIDGQATIGYEILQQQPETDAIIASVGGGGLLSGISHYAKEYKPNIAVYGAETIGADSMSQSIAAQKIITLPAITSSAESLAARRVTEKTFTLINRYVESMHTVSDQAAQQALLNILQHDKLLTEPAAACSAAAAVQIPALRGKNVVIVLCGGNYPLSKLKELL